MTKITSDGSTASYYELPKGATELQHLISHRDMNAQIGEIFRECYRYGMASHCDKLRGAKKILFYAQAEIERLEKGKRQESDDEGWVEWNGGECPVRKGALVDVWHRDGNVFRDVVVGPSGVFAEDWSHDGHDGDIIAYRVVK